MISSNFCEGGPPVFKTKISVEGLLLINLSTLFKLEVSNSFVDVLLCSRCYFMINENRDIINNEDIKLLVKTVETNYRYKNLLVMTMHYINSTNFFMFNISEYSLYNFKVDKEK